MVSNAESVLVLQEACDQAWESRNHVRRSAMKEQWSWVSLVAIAWQDGENTGRHPHASESEPWGSMNMQTQIAKGDEHFGRMDSGDVGECGGSGASGVAVGSLRARPAMQRWQED